MSLDEIVLIVHISLDFLLLFREQGTGNSAICSTWGNPKIAMAWEQKEELRLKASKAICF
jgi:hypothetical protein